LVQVRFYFVLSVELALLEDVLDVLEAVPEVLVELVSGFVFLPTPRASEICLPILVSGFCGLAGFVAGLVDDVVGLGATAPVDFVTVGVLLSVEGVVPPVDGVVVPAAGAVLPSVDGVVVPVPDGAVTAVNAAPWVVVDDPLEVVPSVVVPSVTDSVLTTSVTAAVLGVFAAVVDASAGAPVSAPWKFLTAPSTAAVAALTAPLSAAAVGAPGRLSEIDVEM
jgi:hypothetical protein